MQFFKTAFIFLASLPLLPGRTLDPNYCWHSLRVLFAALAFSASSVLASPITYSITDLGTLGGRDSISLGMNNRGQVVGWSMFNPRNTLRTHAFLWQSGSGMQDLGSGVAHGINDSGQVVGSSDDHAFIWQSGSGMQDLGMLGDNYSSAIGINDSGQVAGASDTDGLGLHAFFWQSGSGMQYLGTLGGVQSGAMAINENGQVVGWSDTPGPVRSVHAFLWQSGSGMQDLGTLGEGNYSVATAINDSAEVVGYYDSPSEPRAFLWRSESGMQDLGPGLANAINNRGQVVGGSDDHAVLWQSGSGMQDLNTLLPADSGWDLWQAFAINDVGQIAGWGLYQGHSRAFLLTPNTVVPEPATYALCGLTLVGMALLRRRR